MLIDSQLYTKGDKFQMIAQLYGASEASIAPMLYCIVNRKKRERENEMEAREKNSVVFTSFIAFTFHTVSFIFCVFRLYMPCNDPIWNYLR